MKNKCILFTAPYVTEIVESDLAEPKPGQVQVKVVVSTISSGTERANLVGDANTNSTRPAAVRFPRRGGYSSAGIVSAVGEGVTRVKPGDRVVTCWGYHGQYTAVPEEDVFPIGEDIPFEEAALWNISTFPMAAVRKCRLEIGESAIVMGMGVLGMMAVMILRAAGATPIIAVDPVPEKREKALSIGADYALDPFAPDFTEQVKALTDGGANVAIEVTGNGKALDQVLDCIAKYARVALLGCTRDSNFTIDYYRKVHGRGITLIGAHTQARPDRDSRDGWWTQNDDLRTSLRLFRLGRLKFSDLVEETHSPAEAPEIYHRLATEKSFPVVQFDWRDFE